MEKSGTKYYLPFYPDKHKKFYFKALQNRPYNFNISYSCFTPEYACFLKIQFYLYRGLK